MTEKFAPISPAKLDWQTVDDVEVPISRQFGDVYFSKANGLLETRHVFLNGNDLTERLARLEEQQYFAVGETGFGTGLNFLALWQLWQQVRPDNRSHLHFISVEKYPLSIDDLKRALKVWDELRPLSQQLIEQYPLPLAGCHRLHFPEERISLDLWLGDAAQCFPLIETTQPVQAWFLDGFAPSCNPELWQEQIFTHIMRLSAEDTTFASFSVAGILKRALRQYGVHITRPKGFGHKREMLKARWLRQEDGNSSPLQPPFAATVQPPESVSIIGAGIAGLNCAWRLAQRGIAVTVFDQLQPLAGGSGNPLAMLNPKLAPIEHAATHLMTVSWQYALRFYRQFSAFRPIHVQQIVDKNIEKSRQLTQDYPQHILSWHEQAEGHPHMTLHIAGALQPHPFARDVLSHPLIKFKQATIEQLIKVDDHHYELIDTQQQRSPCSHVIVCNALAINRLLPQTPMLRPIRGQVSWVQVQSPFTTEQRQTGFSYGGYAIPLDQNQLIFGASFLPQQTETDIRSEDHQHNLTLLKEFLPDLAIQLPPLETWQGRAALRAQTRDYFPLVGQADENLKNIYCLAGLGSKGFLFAPLCSEIIVSQMLGEVLPVPEVLSRSLAVNRFKKKIKPKKTCSSPD